jgi:hypothetical protein
MALMLNADDVLACGQLQRNWSRATSQPIYDDNRTLWTDLHVQPGIRRPIAWLHGRRWFSRLSWPVTPV